MNSTTQTPAPRQRKPRPKPARSIRIILAPTAVMPGIVRITVGKSDTDYQVTLVPADFGRAYRLTKILGNPDTYHVNIDGEQRLCDCKGHGAHGHCKHSDGLAALIAAGKL